VTYLITGATGFLGRRLVELLLSAGHDVQYLGRRRDPSMDRRAAFHHWTDPLNTFPPVDSVPRLHAVIHLAAEPIAQRWTGTVKHNIRESRTAVTRNLVDALGRLRHKPGVLVSSSAIGYYGDRGDEVLTEESAPGHDFLAEVCTAWEREAGRAQEMEIRVVKVRTGIVLGPGGALQQMLPVFRLGLGGRLGTGKQWMSWIHRDDLLNMMIWASENTAVEGPLNGTAPHPVMNEEFTKVLARTMRRPAVIPVPKFAVRLFLGELADFLFHSARAVPSVAEQFGFRYQFDYLTQALAAVLAETQSP
jgi:hypothetical protein